LINVVAGHYSYFGGGPKPSDKFKERLPRPLTCNVPKRNVNQAEAPRQSGAGRNICLLKMDHQPSPHIGIAVKDATGHVAEGLKQRRRSGISDGFSADSVLRLDANDNVVSRTNFNGTQSQYLRKRYAAFRDCDLRDLHASPLFAAFWLTLDNVWHELCTVNCDVESRFWGNALELSAETSICMT
jgi:hypothetical protein